MTTVEHLVVGSDDPADVYAALHRWCETVLGAGVGTVISRHVSVGLVFRVVLADRREVVVKAHQPRWTPAFLAAVVAMQRHLHGRGLPCACPVVGPASLGLGHATAETVLSDPGSPATFGPPERRASAAGLARLVRAAAEVPAPAGLSPHPLDAHPGARWPEPHSPLFDFAASDAITTAIDRLADLARAAVSSPPALPVVVHTDWAARNVRLRASGVVAIYDLDSLAWLPEARAVGQAAATWSAVGAAGEPPAPDVDEMAAYLADYEQSAGRSFGTGERRAFWGGALWALAYTARCEHAYDPRGDLSTRARSRLLADGSTLADLASAPDEF
jgi:Ser/Thr protein kinase RdoA (MazF antagonist)